MIRLEPHPLLAARAFQTSFPFALEATASPDWLIAQLKPESAGWTAPSDELRGAVRDMLRQAGYKPTGRGKPASEYLRKAASEAALGSINVAVDACNVVSLHSGLPISVVDLERSRAPHRIAVARGPAQYVFNASGQSIDIEGLLCLFDAEGACASAVKDSQRTKTHGGTTRTLSVVWGVRGFEPLLERAQAWYRELLTRAGASCEAVALEP
jgi:DNA/RNA-binding domain of Phe-tRNA-synthetase-like protein